MQNVHIASTIKTLCKNRGITVSSMLSECSLTKSFIYDLEKRSTSPSCDKITRIANYLDCSVDYLLGRTDNPEVINERRCCSMDNDFKIDFTKLEETVNKRFQHADELVLKKNPNAKMEDIDNMTRISKTVCLAILQEYHLALTQMIAEQLQSMPQEPLPESKD